MKISVPSDVIKSPPIVREVIELDDEVEVKKEPEDGENYKVSSSAEEDVTEPFDLLGCYVFNWHSDGSKRGYCRDQLGNEYLYNGTRRDGSIGYRCNTKVVASGTEQRCSAIARRRDTKIVLEIPHRHSSHKRKKNKINSSGILNCFILFSD